MEGPATVDGVRLVRYLFPRLHAIDPRRWRAHVNAGASAVRAHLGLDWDLVHVHTLLGGIAAGRAGIDRRYLYSVHSPVALEQLVNWSDGSLPGRLKLAFGLPLLKRDEGGLVHRSTVHALSQYT